MKYTDKYISIILEAQKRVSKYNQEIKKKMLATELVWVTEKHHIIPKSINENLIKDKTI